MKSKAVTQMNSETTLPNSQAESQVTKSAIDLQVEIRYRAYLLYEQPGKEDGHDIDDWLQAESELIEVENKQPLRTSSDDGCVASAESAQPSITAHCSVDTVRST